MVKLRRLQTLEKALNAVSAIQQAEEPLIIDFGEMTFLTPSASLMISSSLRRRPFTPRIDPVRANDGYAAHVGFYDACGIHDIGKAVGGALGGKAYSPIRTLACQTLRNNARCSGLPIAEAVKIPAENLARIIVQDPASPLMIAVTYAVRELFRNVVEHSESQQIWYSGQYWPGLGIAEVCVLDEGIGLLSSLKKNPEYAYLGNEADAIRLAIRPGVSSVDRRKLHDAENSGFGLYIIRRLCLRGNGSFAIVSNNAALEESMKSETTLHSAFRGTILQIRMDIEQLLDAESLIDELVRDGENEIETNLPTL